MIPMITRSLKCYISTTDLAHGSLDVFKDVSIVSFDGK